MLQLGTLVALLCALATNLALLCKYRGASQAPRVELRRPLRSAVALFGSRWWTIGFAIAAGAWALHVAALALAPLSVVETTISGGLVVMAWLAQRWLGASVGPRQWLGLGLCAGGLALLAATSTQGPAESGYETGAMIPFEASAIGAGLVLLASGSSRGPHRARGPLLGGAAGLLLGVANVSLKALTETVPGDPLSIFGPWTAVALLAGAGAFLALARGMQTGAAVPVITSTTVAANMVSILGGVLVYGDPIGADPLAVAARCAAFIAVIAAAVMIPGPLHRTRPLNA